MIAELDAINIYEQMADLTKNEEIRKILLDVAREEKVRVAMFETVLLQADREFLRIYLIIHLPENERRTVYGAVFLNSQPSLVIPFYH
jgi:hypothetical protein